MVTAGKAIDCNPPEAGLAFLSLLEIEHPTKRQRAFAMLVGELLVRATLYLRPKPKE